MNHLITIYLHIILKYICSLTRIDKISGSWLEFGRESNTIQQTFLMSNKNDFMKNRIKNTHRSNQKMPYMYQIKVQYVKLYHF